MKQLVQLFVLTGILLIVSVLGGCGGGASPAAGFTVLDNLKPSVISITPDNGASDVNVTTSIVITFSEPMDRRTVESAFAISPALTGQFIWSQNDTVLTFIPDRALDYHTNYLLDVAAGSTDRAGNLLRAALNTSFSSAGAATSHLATINRPAIAADADMVFNQHGDAVAVWLSDSSGVRELNFAFHDATTGRWNTPQSIPAAHSYRVASNGSDFALGWSDNSGVHAMLISGGVSSASVDIDNTPGYQLRLVSNGSGYALAWTSAATSGEIHASIYDGNWSVAELFICSPPPDPECWTPGSAQLSSDGSGYAVSWLEPGATSNIMARLYRDNGSGSYSWDAPEIIGPNVDNAQVSLVLTSSGHGYGAAWHTFRWVAGSRYEVYANTYDGNAWGTAQQLDGSGVASFPAITTDGDGYAVAWRNKDIATSVSEIRASLFRDNGSGYAWGSVDVLASVNGDMTAPVIDSNGQGYAVGWTETAGCSGCGQNVHARIYASGLWNSSLMLNMPELPPAGVVLDNHAMQLVSNGQGYAAAWRHDDSSGDNSLKLNLFESGAWIGERAIDTGNPANSRLTVNNQFYAAIWSHATTSGDDIMANVVF